MRLNELTIDSPKAARLPTVIAAKRPERSDDGMSAVISGVSSQVATAATKTTTNEIALAWTTESIVIRRVDVGVRVGEPGGPASRCPT